MTVPNEFVPHRIIRTPGICTAVVRAALRVSLRASVRVSLLCALTTCLAPIVAAAQDGPREVCPRAQTGSVVPEPRDLRSENGVLRVELYYRDFVDAKGARRYCYIDKDGNESPTLRLKPGDLLILALKNELTLTSQPAHAGMNAMGSAMMPMVILDACANNSMTPASTNLHFHGISAPPACHQDDTLRTVIEPSDKPFEYRFRIPANQPPGLYWYHPHVHGLSKTQILGGASGALVIEGIERANPLLAGLPARILIVRDQDLVNPDAEPAKSNLPPPIVMRDREGDVLNNGTGAGKPAKDLSINYVPVPFPDYPPAEIRIKPFERQLWRVLNASAITYLNLQILYEGRPQPMGIVALDGVPTNASGQSGTNVIDVSHVIIPPGGRAEFTMTGPTSGAQASLVTRGVDTGPAGENDPLRALAIISAAPDAPEPSAHLATSPTPLPPSSLPWLGNENPIRTRKLYFSETPQNPNDPNSPTTFFITVDGETPAPFDSSSKIPNIVVQQGTVEDWIIENRTPEFHAFHIHQIHFLLTEWNGRPSNEPFLRDTVNVRYWDGKSTEYPSVKLRMDFRDPEIVGTFVYHCHLLEHEDGGMMGTIRVDPAPKDAKASAKPSTITSTNVKFPPSGRIISKN
jgi:FtsP/CotA-like multicopper oxidase with cupredoxin domain